MRRWYVVLALALLGCLVAPKLYEWGYNWWLDQVQIPADYKYPKGTAGPLPGSTRRQVRQWQQASPLNNRAADLIDAGKFEEAIEAAQQAIRIYPQYARAYSNLGGAYIELNRFEEAREALQKAVTLDPGLAEAHSNLGMLEERSGHPAAAIPHLEHAVGLAPDSAVVQKNLGVAAAAAGSQGDAVWREWYARAAKDALTTERSAGNDESEKFEQRDFVIHEVKPNEYWEHPIAVRSTDNRMYMELGLPLDQMLPAALQEAELASLNSEEDFRRLEQAVHAKVPDRLMLTDPHGRLLNGVLEFALFEPKLVFETAHPEPGRWLLRIRGLAGESAARYSLWVVAYSGIRLIPMWTEGERTNNPVLAVSAKLRGQPITGATVRGRLERRPRDKDKGEQHDVLLADDGTGADALAGDGIYSTRVELPFGVYGLTATIEGKTAEGQPLQGEEIMTWDYGTAHIGLKAIGRETTKDTDANGKIDQIAVPVEVEVAKAGTYQISAALMASTGQSVGEGAQQVLPLEPGVHTVSLEFPVQKFAKWKISGPFALNSLVLSQQTVEGFESVYRPSEVTGDTGYRTKAYDWQELEAAASGIYLYDLKSKTQRTLASGGGGYGLPSISGRYVTWTEGPSGPNSLRLHDLVEGTTQSIAPGRRVISADVDGQRVVWYELGADLRSGIYLYNVTEGRVSEIAKVPVVYGGPIMRGNVIVWADYNQGQGDIFVYDIRARQQRQITRQGASDTATYRVATKHLDFDGAHIAWIESTSSTRQTPASSTLVVYDVAVGTQAAFPLPEFTYADVAISGDWVLWGGRTPPLSLTQLSSGSRRVLLEQKDVHSVDLAGDRAVCEVTYKGGRRNQEVVLIDVNTGAVTQLTDTPVVERFPDIDGDYVVWMVE